MAPTRLKHPIRMTLFCAAAALAGSFSAWAIITDIGLLSPLHEEEAEHVDQQELLRLVRSGEVAAAFDLAFEAGDELFEASFNALDGVGANVGQGQRFTRVPRADLSGAGEWARHLPPRATGPNAITCNACHIQLFDDGSGSIVANVHRDPFHTGDLRQFIQRNTPHVFAPGAIQRLAEEMTEELQRSRDAARQRACESGRSAEVSLSAKGIDFGSITARRVRGSPCDVEFDTSRVTGVQADLVVRPFQWKGLNRSVREFNRGAAHDELGMQPVETTGAGVDGDFDGVSDEMTIGDMTALAIYLAAQPRPTTKLELAALEIIEPLPAEEVAQIQQGRRVFERTGCNSCHVPTLKINDPVFSEPSRMAAYRDAVFPAGGDPVSLEVTSAHPVSFDLTQDQPDNQIRDANGNVIFRLGSLIRDERGRGVVELFGDLKRHDMGPDLAEPIDEIGTGASSFLTENLWAVGSTGPYLHDGRATTLTEAILEHGGEASDSRRAFLALHRDAQRALLAFLDNLVLFKMEEEEVVVPPPPTVRMRRSRGK